MATPIMCGSQASESQMLPFLIVVSRKVKQLHYMPRRHRGKWRYSPKYSQSWH